MRLPPALSRPTARREHRPARQIVSDYAIGVDFGTESGRALLLDLGTGEEVAVSVVRYPSTVIDRTLPCTGERVAA